MKALILALIIIVLSTGSACARDWNIEQGDESIKHGTNGVQRAQAYYLRSIAITLNILAKKAQNENERARLETENECK